MKITPEMVREAEAHFPFALAEGPTKGPRWQWFADFYNHALENPGAPCPCCNVTPDGDIMDHLPEPPEPGASTEPWPRFILDEALVVLRNVDTQFRATGQPSARVERLINLLAGMEGRTAPQPPSAPEAQPLAWRFADMLVGVIGDLQDELGFTDEDKACSNGSAEMVAAIRELKERASTPPSAAVGVESVRADYQPAFDTPTTAGEALAWLSKQGEPTCMTFCADHARRAAELLRDALHQPTTDSATASVFAELDRAVRKFPTWPTDPLHAVAVLGEEFGELTKAVLQSVYEPHNVKPGEVRQEALQTAAMALRFLRSVDAYEFAPGAQHEQPALAQQPATVDDSALLDALAREHWKLDPFDMPTPGGDDADVGWRVIQYHGGHPREREVAVHYGDDPRAALRAALAAQQGGGTDE